MLHLPILRWGAPYTSLEVDNVVISPDSQAYARIREKLHRDLKKLVAEAVGL